MVWVVEGLHNGVSVVRKCWNKHGFFLQNKNKLHGFFLAAIETCFNSTRKSQMLKQKRLKKSAKCKAENARQIWSENPGNLKCKSFWEQNRKVRMYTLSHSHVWGIAPESLMSGKYEISCPIGFQYCKNLL